MPLPSLDTIKEDLCSLDEWEDRYRYLMDLGRTLDPLPAEAHSEANKVRGCASQVWLETSVRTRNGEVMLCFRGDSDAHIVRGLVALALSAYSGKTAREILDFDAGDLFGELGLMAHLTSQRSNGVRSLIGRIRDEARQVLETEQAK